MATTLPASKLSTDTKFFEELLQDLNRGLIKVPQFQRKFVWKEPQAYKLLDSINNSYPIGSLLLWRTDQKLAAERNIGDFKLPETDDMSPTEYVLDGQQRLTVIYASLVPSGDKEAFRPGYDLRKKEFVHMAKTDSPVAFPLQWIYNTTKLLDFRTALQTQEDAAELQSTLDSLIAAYQHYKVPVVTLKGLTVEEVCPIFERINSSGTKLSTFDLMVAATWSEDFDLNDEVNEITTSLLDKKFNDLSSDTVLKCLAAVQFGSVREDRIMQLRKVEAPAMHALVAATHEAILRAVDTLSTEFKIQNGEFLPYEALIIILTFVLSNLKSVSGEAARRLRQWFWRSAFSERYRVGGENFVSKDLEKVLLYVRDGQGDMRDFGQSPGLDAWTRTPFRAGNSMSKAVILALARCHPRNLTNGTAIDIAVALAHFNRKEFHHIYPQAFLKREGIRGEHNAIANMCMLAASENKKIGDANPAQYIPALIEAHGEYADEIFASNRMPRPSKFDYRILNYERFLDARATSLEELVQQLVAE